MGVGEMGKGEVFKKTYKNDITVDVNCDHPAEVCLSGCSTVESPFAPFTTVASGGVPVRPTLKSGELVPLPQGQSIYKKTWNLVHRLSSSPFTDLFNHFSISMDSCIFILYFEPYSKATLFVLLLKFLHWPLGAFIHLAPMLL